MKSPHSLLNAKLIALAAALAFWTATAASQCAAPSSSGIRLCQPSSGATLYQVPHIEATATPASGSISDLKVFIDGKLELENGGPSVSLYDGGVSNGTHHLVIQAQDNFGRTYQAGEYFHVIGNLPNCPTSTVGVRICYPAAGQAISQNLPMSIGFKGTSRITRVKAYAGGTLVADFPVSRGQSQIIGQGASTTAGSHTLNVVAWDAAGHTYKSSVNFKAYYDGGCPPLGGVCTPAIYPDTPQDGQDVQSRFRISAGVQNNPAPITTMRVYIAGTVAAQSFGPTLDQQVSAAKGTHIMVIQAWDTAGKLYRFTANVNVQ
ncbi:MAG: hypothetical protein ACM3SW_14470 [Actinomycetota bacterium]